VTEDAWAAWETLDPTGPPEVRIVCEPAGPRVAVLLGAFDPPTNAHLAVVEAAARATGSSGVLCLTRTLLARPDDELLRPTTRLGVIRAVAEDHELGFAVANRGTYVDVSEAFAAGGWDATFVIGSDKLAQLEDPSFYTDGTAGVERTFDLVRFVVVPRPRSSGDRPGLMWLERSEVFQRAGDEALSATEVRDRVRRGDPVDDLVPRTVAAALAGYTRPNDDRGVPTPKRSEDVGP
jgi:nicotinic acid mononucleotide adenylyltransferase